jgi:hypothetical protein
MPKFGKTMVFYRDDSKIYVGAIEETSTLYTDPELKKEADFSLVQGKGGNAYNLLRTKDEVGNNAKDFPIVNTPKITPLAEAIAAEKAAKKSAWSSAKEFVGLGETSVEPASAAAAAGKKGEKSSAPAEPAKTVQSEAQPSANTAQTSAPASGSARVKIVNDGKTYYYPKGQKFTKNKQTGGLTMPLFDAEGQPAGTMIAKKKKMKNGKVEAVCVGIQEPGKDGKFIKKANDYSQNSDESNTPAAAPASAENPVGTPAEAASSASSAKPEVPAVDEGADQSGKAGKDSEDPIEDMRVVLAKDPEHVAERLRDFIRKPEGKTFVKEGVDLGSEDLAAITTWVKDKPGDSTLLYYGLGSGVADVSWIGPELAEMVKKRPATLSDFEKRLASCLDRWAGGTDKPDYCGEGSKDLAVSVRKPLAGSANHLEWIKAFLTDAAKHGKLLVEKTKVQGSIDDIDSAPAADEGAVAVGPGSGKKALSAYSTQPFDTRQLFGAWGDYNVVFINGRKIAITLRARREMKNNYAPHYRDQIGIYDISDPTKIYGRRFDIDKDSEKPFVLDDGNPDGKQYNLKFVAIPSADGRGVADTRIDLQSAEEGKAVEFGGGNKEVTLNGLYKSRAENVRRDGNIVEIGGQSFYSSGESSDMGALLFWPKAMIDGLDSYEGSPRDLRPEHMTFITRPSGSGPELIGEEPERPLGKIGGEWYKLVWNDKAWVPTKMPEPPPDKLDAGEKNESGGEKSIVDTQEGRMEADGWPDLKEANIPHAVELNKSLSKELQKKVHFYWDGKNQDSSKMYVFCRPEGVTDFEKLKQDSLGNAFYSVPKGEPGDAEELTIENGHVLVGKSADGKAYTELNALCSDEGVDFNISKLAMYDKQAQQFEIRKGVADLSKWLVKIGFESGEAKAIEKRMTVLSGFPDNVTGPLKGQKGNICAQYENGRNIKLYPVTEGMAKDEPCPGSNADDSAVPGERGDMVYDRQTSFMGSDELEGKVQFTIDGESMEAKKLPDYSSSDAAVYQAVSDEKGENKGAKYWFASFLIDGKKSVDGDAIGTFRTTNPIVLMNSKSDPDFLNKNTFKFERIQIKEGSDIAEFNMSDPDYHPARDLKFNGGYRWCLFYGKQAEGKYSEGANLGCFLTVTPKQ